MSGVEAEDVLKLRQHSSLLIDMDRQERAELFKIAEKINAVTTISEDSDSEHSSYNNDITPSNNQQQRHSNHTKDRSEFDLSKPPLPPKISRTTSKKGISEHKATNDDDPELVKLLRDINENQESWGLQSAAATAEEEDNSEGSVEASSNNESNEEEAEDENDVARALMAVLPPSIDLSTALAMPKDQLLDSMRQLLDRLKNSPNDDESLTNTESELESEVETSANNSKDSDTSNQQFADSSDSRQQMNESETETEVSNKRRVSFADVSTSSERSEVSNTSITASTTATATATTATTTAATVTPTTTAATATPVAKQLTAEEKDSRDSRTRSPKGKSSATHSRESMLTLASANTNFQSRSTSPKKTTLTLQTAHSPKKPSNNNNNNSNSNNSNNSNSSNSSNNNNSNSNNSNRNSNSDKRGSLVSGKQVVAIDPMEYHSLRQNYDTLLRVLQKERSEMKALKEKMAEIERDSREMKTTADIEVQNAQIENVELRSRLRKLESQSKHSDLFTKYNDDISKLTSQISALQQKNDTLQRELQQRGPSESMIDSLDPPTNEQQPPINHTYSNELDESKYLAAFESLHRDQQIEINYQVKQIVNKRFRELTAEVKLYKSENTQLKRRLRLANMCAKHLEEAGKRIERMTVASEKQEKQLLSLQQQKQQMEFRLQQTESYCASIKANEEKLLEAKRNQARQIVELKENIQQIVSEKRAEALLQIANRNQQNVVLPGNRKTLQQYFSTLLKEAERLPKILLPLQKLQSAVHDLEHELLDYAARERDFIAALSETTAPQHNNAEANHTSRSYNMSTSTFSLKQRKK